MGLLGLYKYPDSMRKFDQTHGLKCLRNLLLIHKIHHLIADLCSNQSPSQSICEYILASCTGEDIWISLKIYLGNSSKPILFHVSAGLKWCWSFNASLAKENFTDLKTITNSIHFQKAVRYVNTLHMKSWQNICDEMKLNSVLRKHISNDM